MIVFEKGDEIVMKKLSCLLSIILIISTFIVTSTNTVVADVYPVLPIYDSKPNDL